jgi:hypothetical protein
MVCPYVLNFDGDLHGQTLSTDLLERLRLDEGSAGGEAWVAFRAEEPASSDGLDVQRPLQAWRSSSAANSGGSSRVMVHSPSRVMSGS